MEKPTTHIRMWYRESDIVIAIQQHQTEQWQRTIIYTNHHKWLSQVYRTLLHTDQPYVFIHDITNHTPSIKWHSVCAHTMVLFATMIHHECVHVMRVTSIHQDLMFIENWLPHMALQLASAGHRINGIMSPAHPHYINFLHGRESRLMSGALFGWNGEMVRNGSSAAERILAQHRHSITTPRK